jgi:hypothetical protein
MILEGALIVLAGLVLTAVAKCPFPRPYRRQP